MSALNKCKRSDFGKKNHQKRKIIIYMKRENIATRDTKDSNRKNKIRQSKYNKLI